MATCYKSPLANPHSTLLLQCLTSRQPSELPPSLPDLLPRRRSHRYLRSGSARTSQLSTTTKTRGKNPPKIADARPGKSCVTNPSINGLCPTVWCSHTVRRLPSPTASQAVKHLACAPLPTILLRPLVGREKLLLQAKTATAGCGRWQRALLLWGNICQCVCGLPSTCHNSFFPFSRTISRTGERGTSAGGQVLVQHIIPDLGLMNLEKKESEREGKNS